MEHFNNSNYFPRRDFASSFYGYPRDNQRKIRCDKERFEFNERGYQFNLHTQLQRVPKNYSNCYRVEENKRNSFNYRPPKVNKSYL